MSEKKNVKSGSVFELKLDGDTGYGYVKMLISHDIDSSVTYIVNEQSGTRHAVRPLNMFMQKIYNVFSSTPLKATDFDPARFETDDILCFPPLMYWRPKLKGPDSWRFVGESALTDEDRVLPDYIDRGPGFYKDSDLEDVIKRQGFVTYLSGLRPPHLHHSSFDSVKHLGISPSDVQNPGIIRFLTMYWRNQQGKDPMGLYRKYLDGEHHPNPDFDDINGGLVLYERDNEAFRKMEKIKRMKCGVVQL